jgi:hypothetical protein
MCFASVVRYVCLIAELLRPAYSESRAGVIVLHAKGFIAAPLSFSA